MDERPLEATGRIAREMTVLRERAQVLLDARRERVRRVVVVMEVKLDLAEAGARERRELIEEARPVLLAGKEEAVARRTPVAVAELAERRIVLCPRVDAAVADVVGSASPQRLVVITQREQHVA
jgi:hypothetical protein